MTNLRKPLVPISINNKRSAQEAGTENAVKRRRATSPTAPMVPAAVSASAAPKPTTTTTTTELAAVSRKQARETVQRLIDGYNDRSGSGYGPALSNAAGCILVQKAPNRSENGYVQIAPLAAPRARSTNGVRQKKQAPQNAHRLVIVGWKSEEEKKRMLDGEHASHLCHNPTCVAPAHIVVEPKELNEGRKKCRALGPIILTTIRGRDWKLPPNGTCDCANAKCIFMIECRSAE